MLHLQPSSRQKKRALTAAAGGLSMSSTAYDAWDRSAAAARALKHADSSCSVDCGGGVWNFAYGSNMSSAKVFVHRCISSSLAHF
jgi:hypothetical protein